MIARTPIFAILFMVFSAHATDYYVSPQGSDRNPGTKQKPWKSLTKAATAPRPGDTVFFFGGTYQGPLQIKVSGSTGAPIAYRAVPGERPVIASTTSITMGGAIMVSGRAHIIIDGLIPILTGGKKTEAYHVVLRNSRSVTLRNLSIEGMGDPVQKNRQRQKEGGIKVSGSRDITIEQCSIHNISHQGIKISDDSTRITIKQNKIFNTYGDSVRIHVTTRNKGTLQGIRIINNMLAGSLTSDGIQTDPPYQIGEAERRTLVVNRGIIIRGNTINNHAENGIDLKGAGDVLIESNILYGNVGDNDGYVGDKKRDTRGGNAIHVGGGQGSDNVIVRFNVIYDNRGGVFAKKQWYVYNNTILGNNRTYQGPNTSGIPGTKTMFVGARLGDAKSQYLVNNIIGGHYSAEVSTNGRTSTGRVDHNLFLTTPAHQPLFLVREKQVQGLSAWKAATGLDQHSLVTLDAGFASGSATPIAEKADRYDFSLKPASTARDRGTHLAVTASRGSGNTVPVDYAGCFFDGYGVEQGDLLFIGNTEARVVHIDRAKSAIRLDRNIAWSEGTRVSLATLGFSPDVGAHVTPKSVSDRPPRSDIAPPSNLTLEIIR